MSLYYDYDKILSRNCLINFIISVRGVGKTYGGKDWLLNRWVKKNEAAIYIRQNANQVDPKKIKRPWIPPELNEKYENIFQQKNNEVIDTTTGETAVYLFGLSEYLKLKSNEWDNVTTILFDEFTDSPHWSLSVPKPKALLNLIDSVFRNRDNVRVICTGNADEMDNVYFHYLNIPPLQKGQEWYQDKNEICVNVSYQSAFVAERKKTRFGKIISKTEYGEMALENKFSDEDLTNVQVKTKAAQPMIVISGAGETVTFWFDSSTKKIYVTQGTTGIDNRITIDENETASMTYYKYSKLQWQQQIVTAISNQSLFFNDISARTSGILILKKLGIF